MRTKKNLRMAGIFGYSLCMALRFADGGGDAGAAGTAGDGGKGAEGDTGAGDDGGKGAEEKQFTQGDIDAAVEKRLARERKKWEKEHPAPAAQQTPPAGDTGAAASQAAPAAAAQTQAKDDSAEKIAKANQRIIATEAKAAALAAGANPDKVAYVVRLAELSGIDVDEDDGPDTDAIKKAIDKVLKDMPEFKTVKDDGQGGAGFQIGANGSNQGTAKQSQQVPGAVQQNPTKRWNKFR